VWVPHGVTSPASKPAPPWASLFKGLHVLAGACSSTGLPMGSQPPSGIHLLWRGVPCTGYRWITAPPWTSMYCRGITCLTMVFIMSCKGRLSASASRASPPPFFFRDLVSADVGIPGRAGTYCEQPRHSEYGLDRSVAVQASRTSKGRLRINRQIIEL